jgi:uncharacterized protein YhaN
MRLRRLDLTRYGRFTGRSIDFGLAEEKQPDLHILYGPNEAGKSTALAAFLDFLFGIEPRSRFNFLHSYQTMRIGAALELARGTRELVRVKRAQNSLLDASDQPVPEAILQAELGNIDRDSYRTMFSLDDDTLEKGGESILASKGDLGQLLFSASAGLSDLGRNLEEIRGEADRFYKYRARSGELADLKARLATLRAEREKIDTFAAQYAQLVATRDKAFSLYNDVLGERARIASRCGEIDRLLIALPRLGELRDIRQRLLPLADLPDVPRDWAEQLPAMQKDEVALETRAQAVEDEVARLEGELAAIVVDQAALALTQRFSGLSDLRARYVTATKDIPERRLQSREVDLVISGILERIERKDEPQPGRLLLGASIATSLQELIESWSGIEAAQKAAETELDAARGRVEEARVQLEEAGGASETERNPSSSVSTLGPVVAALRADDHVARRRLADRALGTHLRVLGERLRDLHPWSGDVEQLAGLKLPDASTVARWKEEAAAQRLIDRHEDDIERLTTERDRIRAERDALGGIGVVGDREAGEVRMARERAWASHRRTLDEASADTFEAALRQDDIVTTARLGHTTDLVKLQEASRAFAVAEQALGRAVGLCDAAAAILQRVRDEIAAALGNASPALPVTMTLPQLDAWLTRRASALEVRANLLSVQHDRDQADLDARMARDRLTAALAARGIAGEAETSFEALLEAAQGAIDREGELENLRAALAARQRDLLRRERDAEKVAASRNEWTAAWQAACKRCWLGDADPMPSMGAVREILAALVELRPALEKRAGFADRIEKMENDQAAFALELEAMAGELGVASAGLAPLDLAREIQRRVDAARAAEAERIGKKRDLEAALAKQRALAEDAAIHARLKAERTGFFGVQSLGEMAVKLQAIERRSGLQEQYDAAVRDIVSMLQVSTIDEAERLLDGLERGSLEAELAELKPRSADLDQRSRDLFSEHSKAVDDVEAVGGDDAVARIEEQRRTTQLDVEDKALHYLRLRLGSAAAEYALRAYREQHRSSMMARASDAFRMISRGTYEGLATQPDKDGETLIAVGADGRSKTAMELSRGARFQLYLALRVAGYHEFARSRPSVPFVADDIMESFDDFRAEEAFRLFAEMAGVGQVIYLTHHRHLAEIALRVCPTARLHQLEV